MFDFKRDRGDGGRYQEALDAYLDNALTPAERARFEAQMAADPRLRSEMEQLRALRLQLRAMPRRRVPRSFALDPATYRRPQAQPLLQLYPVLRGATALSAFLLIFVLALGAFQGQFRGAGPTVASVAQEDAATESEIAAFEAAPEAAESSAAGDAAPSAPPTEEVAAAEAVEAPPADLQLLGTPAPGEEAANLALEAPAPEALTTSEADARETAPVEPTVPAVETIQVSPQEQPAPPAAQRASLLPLQIGLGAVFVLALALALLARRARPF